MLAEDIDAMLDDLDRHRTRLLARAKRRKARRTVLAISHGHATGSSGGTVHLWGAGHTRKGRIRDVRVDLDQVSAARLYQTLRDLGHGDD